ncbi:MAG: ADP-ribosylglycohydrolase family protein [Rhodothermales bacterium]|nr:ADP-ribosylglycohydrolase family protein [Rhodothermales bacterium]
MQLVNVRRCIIAFVLAVLSTPLIAAAQADLTSRIEGLLIGGIIGDAAGGPDEFQDPEQSVWTSTDAVLTSEGIAELRARFRLKPYTRRPYPESYAQWRADSPPGTITDDSRFKILFFNSLAETGRPDRLAFARALLAWRADTLGVYGTLPREWLDEFAYAARWELGERDPRIARPPGRQWGGLPTMAGQMPFLPVAAFYPGDPEAAYKTTWEIDFIDNGIGFDLNAGLVAGLAAALAPGATWESVEAAMRDTDPYRVREVPWVERRLDRWLDIAHAAARESEGRAARLFAILERELDAEQWWEAWVPMTVVFACADLTDRDPLATLQLIMEFGHDTDSYMQVAGALFGALHGKEVFPEDIRATISERLLADYGVSVEGWMELIDEHR